MKRINQIMLLCCVFLAVTSLSALCQEAGKTTVDQQQAESTGKDLINWMKFDEGMKKAGENNLPIYVEFFATWCPPCKTMAQTTFQDKNVASLLNDNFVAVKVDIDKEKDLALKYGARSIPHHVVMNSKGEVVKVLRGALPADMFIANLKDIPK